MRMIIVMTAYDINLILLVAVIKNALDDHNQDIPHFQVSGKRLGSERNVRFRK